MPSQSICFANAGTSIITNHLHSLDETTSKDFRERLQVIEGTHMPSEFDKDGHQAPGQELITEIIDGARLMGLNKASAELNSTLLIAERAANIGEPLRRVHLYVTDTSRGMIAAKAVKILLAEELPDAEILIERISGLQVTNAHAFRREGLPEYVQRIYKNLENAPPEAFTRIFNPTGGFKSVVPYLTMIAMLEGAQTQYIFEFSSELIELLPLPIALNDALVQTALPLLSEAEEGKVFSQQELEEALELNIPLYQSPHASLWQSIDGEYIPSGLGEIVLRRAERNPDPIYLSSVARRELDKLDPDNSRLIIKNLQQMRYPAYRKSGNHEKYETRKTDCIIYGSGQKPRIFYTESQSDSGTEVRVMRIFTIHRHDEKDREVNTLGIFSKDYSGFKKLDL